MASYCAQVQISAYLDNVFDVAALMDDSETKTAALEKVADLELEVEHVNTFKSSKLHLNLSLFLSTRFHCILCFFFVFFIGSPTNVSDGT